MCQPPVDVRRLKGFDESSRAVGLAQPGKFIEKAVPLLE
jgi:hypothetical protein